MGFDVEYSTALKCLHQQFPNYVDISFSGNVSKILVQNSNSSAYFNVHSFAISLFILKNHVENYCWSWIIRFGLSNRKYSLTNHWSNEQTNKKKKQIKTHQHNRKHFKIHFVLHIIISSHLLTQSHNYNWNE